jgi:restriction system protein
MAKRYRSRRRKRRQKQTPIPLSLLVVFPLALLFYVVAPQIEGVNPALVILGFVGLAAAMVLAVMAGVFFWQRYQKLRRKKALKLADIDTMPGLEFEHYVAELLRHQGFTNVQVTPGGNDFGIDVLFQKEETTFAAQVKRRRGYVGVDALYQALGGRDYYNRDQSVVISNTFYSKAAHKLAKKTNLWLVDRDTLADWIISFANS